MTAAKPTRRLQPRRLRPRRSPQPPLPPKRPSTPKVEMRRIVGRKSTLARMGRGRPGLRQPRRAAAGAGDGRRPRRCQRHRAQGADHEGRREERQGAAGGCSSRRRGRDPRPEHRALAQGRLRQVRRDRARAAVADQEDQRPERRPQLGDDPARHPQRRGRHHRPRGVPQADQRRAAGREGDDGRAAGEGLRRVAAAVPGLQLVARRRRAGDQALLQHRLRGRHPPGADGARSSRTPTARACWRSPAT